MQLVYRWVRCSPYLCFLAWLATGLVRAQSAPGPVSVLAQPVRLPAGWAPLAQVLAEASRQSGVPISYSSTRLGTTRRVYVPPGPARPLGAILHDVLSPQQVSYGLISGQVVLWTDRKTTPPGVTNVNEYGTPVPKTANPAALAAAAPGAVPGQQVRAGASSLKKVVSPVGGAVVSSTAPSLGTAGAAATGKPFALKRLAGGPRGNAVARPQMAEQPQLRATASASASSPARAKLLPPHQLLAVDSLAGRPVRAILLPAALPASLALAAPAPAPVAAGHRRRFAQVSLVYPLGTNGLANARTVNQVSVNALVGYAAGVEGVEIGGLMNVVRDSVHGAQVAGLLNLTGGAVRGVQVAGLANVVRDDARAVQLAGLVNIVGGRPAGAPSATAPGSPLQLAGVANLTGTDVRGLQAAPLLNRARRVRGVQFGLVNIAHHVRGVQLALINIADSVEGAPVGFINIVRHGYWRGEVWASETLPLNAVLKMGVRRYYSVLGISAQPFGNRLQWALCSGIGTVGRPHGRFIFSLDILQWGLAGSKNDDPDDVPGLLQVRPAVAWQFERESHLQLVISPTFNLAVANRTAVQPDWDFGANQLLIINSVGAETITRLWPGLQLGLRF
ncbi:hypothetical protein IC235_08705 [Hymenobacter sp. BT664]|uniref:Secretin/TonB short N-terminal domain-containing protein n=1 Tax=Hymenobacter montanus TaxID=2771359 RepID=A0A927BCJ3_9BACT|nr:hypothetical protein [Hymenobacter montanus]MBD2767971.1 hypothetical protein [Hymenobacter montanus]